MVLFISFLLHHMNFLSEGTTTRLWFGWLHLSTCVNWFDIKIVVFLHYLNSCLSQMVGFSLSRYHAICCLSVSIGLFYSCNEFFFGRHSLVLLKGVLLIIRWKRPSMQQLPYLFPGSHSSSLLSYLDDSLQPFSPSGCFSLQYVSYQTHPFRTSMYSKNLSTSIQSMKSSMFRLS